jgi:Fe-S cluster biogenesis protein NfuA
MHAERTPNPNSIKWVMGQPLVAGGASAHFTEPTSPEHSPLAAALFAVPGVMGVFVASNFVTVTKADDGDWADLAEPVVAAIKQFVDSGQPALGAAFEATTGGPEGEVAERIARILEDEIRPAVAMDGGDVIFAGYRQGRVELVLQGSCAGCPSSTATLKLGIEARLKEEIPEITEVVAL